MNQLITRAVGIAQHLSLDDQRCFFRGGDERLARFVGRFDVLQRSVALAFRFFIELAMVRGPHLQEAVQAVSRAIDRHAGAVFETQPDWCAPRYLMHGVSSRSSVPVPSKRLAAVLVPRGESGAEPPKQEALAP